MWYGLLALLALATISNALYLAWAMQRRYRARRGRSSDRASASKSASSKLSLRRLPHALIAGSRILFFRLRVPLVELSVLEIVFTVLYVGACLVWCFAPCAHTFGVFPCKVPY